MKHWHILSCVFFPPWFLLVAIAWTVINTISPCPRNFGVGRINLGTFCAALISCCSGYYGSSMQLSSAISDSMSNLQSSSLSFGISKAPFQLSQCSVSEMLSGTLSSSLSTGGRLILQIRLTFNTWVRPAGRFFPDNGGGRGDHSDNFNAAAPSCWKSDHNPLTVSWVSEMYPTASVSNGSGNLNRGPGLDRKHGSVQFEIRQTPDLLVLGVPNSAPYPSTRRVRCVWLDQSGPNSGFLFLVVLLMVTFRYPSVNRTILTMVRRCVFGMYW